MACPFFYPVARLESSNWAVAPRLPLGDAYCGECRAPGEGLQPDEGRQRDICNLGYGRTRCDRFPAEAPADAVRFHVAEDTGELVRIQYVFEKDGWPGEHGAVNHSDLQIPGDTAGEILRRQMTAFLESYKRRRA